MADPRTADPRTASHSSNAKTRRPVLTRLLAAMALVAVYCVGVIGASGLLVAATTTSAQARGWGRGGGRGWGGGGWGRGRGWGRGFYGGPVIVPVVPGCYWSRRWHRRICPYY